jgi:hypothetical protein
MPVAALLPIQPYAQAKYAKCECCSRVRDIYYHMNVMNPAGPHLIVGGFELCESCGDTLSAITVQELDRGITIAKFDLKDEI